MHNTIVAMVSEDDFLKEICVRIDQRRIFTKKKLRNFQKKIEEAEKTLDTENRADLVLIQDWLQNKGRLPSNYNKQMHSIGFNIKENGIHVTNHFDQDTYSGGSPLLGPRMGSFKMDDLPAELKEALISFIKGRHNGK